MGKVQKVAELIAHGVLGVLVGMRGQLSKIESAFDGQKQAQYVSQKATPGFGKLGSFG